MKYIGSFKRAVSCAAVIALLSGCGPVSFKNDDSKSESVKAGEDTGDPLPTTDNPAVDSTVNAVADVVTQIDPEIKRRNIYYVHTGVVVGSIVVDVLVQRKLLENPDLCQLSVSVKTPSPIPGAPLLVAPTKNIPIDYCSAFQLARSVREKNGGSCEARATTRDTNVAVQIPTVLDVGFRYEIDSNCVCFKHFDFDLVRNANKTVHTAVDVRAFIAQDRCKTYFSEYAK